MFVRAVICGSFVFNPSFPLSALFIMVLGGLLTVRRCSRGRWALAAVAARGCR